MTFKTSTLIWIFLWSIFMGITAGAIGLGAIFPALDYLTKPVVCPNGQLQMISQEYNPSPVETVTTETWYCVNASTGDKQEVNMFTMALVSGPIYGLILFVLILAGMWINSRRKKQSDGWKPPAGWEDGSGSGQHLPGSAVLSSGSDREEEMLAQIEAQERSARPASGGHQTAEQRLTKLKSLHDSGLITEQDYEKKKTQILNEV